MDKTQAELIEAYLADETKLYQDWYQAELDVAEDLEEERYGLPPSLEEYKARFKQYFLSKQAFFKQKICVEWDYPHKKPTYDTPVMLIGAITDFLATDGLAIITILVVEGYLDRLCQES